MSPLYVTLWNFSQIDCIIGDTEALLRAPPRIKYNESTECGPGAGVLARWTNNA